MHLKRSQLVTDEDVVEQQLLLRLLHQSKFLWEAPGHWIIGLDGNLLLWKISWILHKIAPKLVWKYTFAKPIQISLKGPWTLEVVCRCIWIISQHKICHFLLWIYILESSPLNKLRLIVFWRILLWIKPCCKLAIVSQDKAAADFAPFPSALQHRRSHKHVTDILVFLHWHQFQLKILHWRQAEIIEPGTTCGAGTVS